MSPDRKRGRDAAHRRAAAQAAAREQHRRRQQRLRLVIGAIVAIAVIGGIALRLTGDDGDDSTTTADAFGSTTSTTAVADDEPSASAPFEYGTGECPPNEKPAEPVRAFDDAPQRCIDDGTDYTADVVTSEGSFTIDLLEDQAPGTVNNFVVLARYAYFDGLTFHRVVKDFVNQGGDPEGSGSGGPGYAIADELPTSVADYVPGAVAMANSGPNTNGSQFFTCLDCSVLPTAGYSLFGQVVEGMDTLQKINDLSTGDGPPSKPVTITSVTITEQ